MGSNTILVLYDSFIKANKQFHIDAETLISKFPDLVEVRYSSMEMRIGSVRRVYRAVEKDLSRFNGLKVDYVELDQASKFYPRVFRDSQSLTRNKIGVGVCDG